MPGETLTFDIFANDRASETFRRLGLAADSASGDVKQLGDRLDKLGSRVSTARVALEGNKEAGAELDKLDVKLIRLGKRVANPGIDVEGKVKALADIAAVDLAMDRLNKKFATPSIGSRVGKGLVSARGFGSLIGSLFSGGSGAGAAAAPAAQAGGGFLDFLGSPAGIGSAALAAFPAASLLDALTGFGIGGAGALGAGLAVQKFQPAALAPGLSNISRTLSTVTQSIGPSLGLMMVQFGKFVQGLAPTLAKLFASTLPFMRQFLSFAEQAAKIALPALTQVMQQMVSSGALKAMTQGFVILVQGLAGFIKELGPGFKAGAEIFRSLAIGIRGLLYGLGAVFGWLGKTTQSALTFLHDQFDRFRHDTAVIFDGLRHDLAAIWNTIVKAAASAWGIVWNGIKDATLLGIKSVVGYFGEFPDKVLRALFGLGHTLYGFAHAALTEFLDGFKAVGGSVLSWVGNFVSSIWDKVKNFFHFGSPSKLFYWAGKNLMLGLFHGIKDHAHLAADAAQKASSSVSGALGGDALANQALARRIFPFPASQWEPFVSLVMAESGFDRFARNPSSGAYGIAQALPPTKYPFAGQAAGGSHAGPQLSWMFDYISQRYGNPANAWAHEVAEHWYGSGLQGGLFTKPTLIGVGERGPEMVSVTPVGLRGGGGNVYINVTVGHGTHPVQAAQELAKILNAGAHLGGVRLRTSILGPG